MSNKKATLKINNSIVEFSEGQTILEVAKDAGIYIPTLCYIEGLTPYGGCRLCIVKVEGMRHYPPACTTPASKNMNIITKDEELQELRREVMKLILSEHPYSCLVCDNRNTCEEMRLSKDKAGRMLGCFSCFKKEVCEVREIVDYLGIDDIPYKMVYKNYPVKKEDPFIMMDYNLCILCGKCVRICNELRGIGAINFKNRGHDTCVSTAFDLLHLDSNCQFCGSCVDICPTGSLSSKNTKWFNKSSESTNSICRLCGVGCSFSYFSYEGKLVESIPTEESRSQVCMFGRFSTVAFNNGNDRLKNPLIKKNNDLIPSKWDEIYDFIKENLTKYKPEEIAIIASSDLSNESSYILSKFSKLVLKTDNILLSDFLRDKPISVWRKANSEGVFRNISYKGQKNPIVIKKDIKEGKIKALYLTERLENSELLKNIEFLIIQDIYPSDNLQYANAVLPTTTFIEDSGSCIDNKMNIKKFNKGASYVRNSLPDWKIFCELSQVIDESCKQDFGFSNPDEIFNEMVNNNSLIREESLIESKVSMEALGLDITPFELDVSKYIMDLVAIDSFKYRGEKISNHVADLKQLINFRNFRKSKEDVKHKKEGTLVSKFKVKSKEEIGLNVYKLVIEAPLLAKKAKPGNFIIVMKDETSERIPLTLSDWDDVEGTITVYIIDRGYSSSELIEISEGDYIYSVVGPLGNAFEIKNFGTVLLGGGCYGIGAIFPIARALKSVENKVIVVLESRNELTLYLEKEFENFADKVIYITADGSKGIKGRISTIETIINENKPIDQCFFVGCKHMMMEASNTTKKMGNIPTLVSMNTIMIDGTGMCGGCRLSLIEDGKEITKFACVDGPIFDGHLINWEELMSRLEQFNESEIEVYQNHSCRAIEKFITGETDE